MYGRYTRNQEQVMKPRLLMWGWDNRNSAQHFECGKMIGTRSANVHQGQRSYAPRKQAGHMSALARAELGGWRS